MVVDAQMAYTMLVLPALFGLTLIGEGVFKIAKYQPGWGSVIAGGVFMVIVTFGYFYLKTLL